MADFKVIVCGDRRGYPLAAVRKILVALHQDHGDQLVILHGEGRGVDAIVGDMARGMGLRVQSFPHLRNGLTEAAEFIEAMERDIDRWLVAADGRIEFLRWLITDEAKAKLGSAVTDA